MDPITYKIKTMIHRGSRADKHGYHSRGGHFLSSSIDPNHLCHLNDTTEIKFRQIKTHIQT